jgi:hypothetical protein
MPVLSCRGCLVPKVPSPTCYILAVLSSDALSTLCLSPSMPPYIFPSHPIIPPPLSLCHCHCLTPSASPLFEFPVVIFPLSLPSLPFRFLSLPLCLVRPVSLSPCLFPIFSFCLCFLFVCPILFLSPSPLSVNTYLPSISPPPSVLLTVLC